MADTLKARYEAAKKAEEERRRLELIARQKRKEASEEAKQRQANNARAYPGSFGIVSNDTSRRASPPTRKAGDENARTSGYDLITSDRSPTASDMVRDKRNRVAAEKAREEEITRRRLELEADSKRQATEKTRKELEAKQAKNRLPDEDERRPALRVRMSGQPDEIAEGFDAKPPKTMTIHDEEIPVEDAVSKIPEDMAREARTLASPLAKRALTRARTEELIAEGLPEAEAAAQAQSEAAERATSFQKGREAIAEQEGALGKESTSFLSGLDASFAAPIKRMQGLKQEADVLEAVRAGMGAELEDYRFHNYPYPRVMGAVSGAIDSSAQMVPGMVAGAIAGPTAGLAVMAAQYGGQEYSQASYEATEAGLAGKERDRYALIQAGIEATIMPIMSKIPGMAGIEGRVLKQSIGRNMMQRVMASPTMKTVITGGKRLARDSAAEVIEEVVTEVLHGVGRQDLLDQRVDFARTVGDTILQTMVMMGAVESAQQVGNAANRWMQSKAATDFVEQPSRKKYEAAVKAGMPPIDDGKSSEGRAKYAEELRNQQAAPLVEAPSGTVSDDEEMARYIQDLEGGDPNEEAISQTQPAPDQGVQEGQQGRQEGLLSQPQAVRPRGPLQERQLEQPEAVETPSGIDGMTAPAVPNESVQPGASPPKDLSGAVGGVGAAIADNYYRAIYEAIQKTGDVPQPEKKSSVGKSWEKAKAAGVTPEDFITSLRSGSQPREAFEKEYRDTFEQLFQADPSSPEAAAYKAKMQAMATGRPDWASEIESTIAQPQSQTPPVVASGGTSPDQPAPSQAGPVSEPTTDIGKAILEQTKDAVEEDGWRPLPKPIRAMIAGKEGRPPKPLDVDFYNPSTGEVDGIEPEKRNRVTGVTINDLIDPEPVPAEPQAEKPPTPRRGVIGDMLATGEVVQTSSGRATTPFPKIATDTSRKLATTLRKAEEWLQSNALAEAEARGDEFNAMQFRNEKPGKMPKATKDSMEEYLFGEQPAVVPSILKPVTTATDKTPEQPTTTPVEGFAALPQKSQDLFNKAFESKDVDSLKQIVGKNNVAWTKEFENRTGIKLPKTVKGRNQAVMEWAKPAEKSAAEPEQASQAKEVAPAMPANEPWQMSRSEYVASQRLSEPSKKEIAAKKRELESQVSLRQISPDQADATLKAFANRHNVDDSIPNFYHRKFVEKAVETGKPVPDEVLADYPDLKPTPKTQENKPTADTVATDDDIKAAIRAEKKRREEEKAAQQKPVSENRATPEILRERISDADNYAQIVKSVGDDAANDLFVKLTDPESLAKRPSLLKYDPDKPFVPWAVMVARNLKKDAEAKARKALGEPLADEESIPRRQSQETPEDELASLYAQSEKMYDEIERLQSPRLPKAQEPAKLDRPLVVKTRAEWDREIKTRLRSIMSEVDYDNADVERQEGLDAIYSATSFLEDNSRTYDKGALSRFENQAVTDMPEDGLLPEPKQKSGDSLPWRNSAVDDESKWFGVRVSVAPSNRREEAYNGSVVRVLNNGDMVEVQPDGQDGTFRVNSDRITLVEEVDRLQPPRLPKAQEPAKPIEQPAIPKFTRTTPDKSSITRTDRDERITQVRESVTAIEAKIRAKKKEHDGFRSNATKKRGAARQELNNLESRKRDLEQSIRRDELNSNIANLEDAMESPRSYDHYLAGMMAIHNANASLDEAAWRDGSKSREASQKGYTAEDQKSAKFRDELYERAVAEGKVQGLDELDAKQAASSAVAGFSVFDDRPLSHFVERAADRIREARMAFPMSLLFPPTSVYGGQKTTLSNEQRDKFADQLREASKDDRNATAKISAIKEKIEQAIQEIKDKAAAEEKKKADTAAEEKAKAEQENLKYAREKAKRYFQEQRIKAALKDNTTKTQPVFIRQGSENGPITIVEGERTDGDKKGELYPNGLILHPSFAEDSKDFALVHKRSGLAFPYIAPKSEMKSLISLIDLLGIDFNSVDVDAEGNLPSEFRDRLKTVNAAWHIDDYSGLSDQDRATVEKLAAVTPTDVQADLILTADDLGANGIPPGMDSVMTDRGVKIVKDMTNAVPEFAYDPVFTVQGGNLVFHDGYTFRIKPQAFNLHPSELTEGQTVGINLEDLGIKRATPQDVVADALKNAGLPRVTKSKSGRDVTAGYIGATVAVHQGEQDNDWSVVSGPAKVRDMVISALDKIRWRQPGQAGDPSTNINNQPSVETDVKVAQPSAPPASPIQTAVEKTRAELRELQLLNRQYDQVIVKEWKRAISGGTPAMGIPLTPELSKALAGRMLNAVKAEIKKFELFILELRKHHDDQTINGLRPNIMRMWNGSRERHGLDEATDEIFDSAMETAADDDMVAAIAAVNGEEPAETPPSDEPPETQTSPDSPSPESRQYSTKNAFSERAREELGMSARPPVPTLEREPSIEMAKAYGNTKAGSDHIDTLVSELAAVPRAVSPFENDLLNFRNAELGNKLRTALQKQIAARKSGNDADEASAARDAAIYRKEKQELIELVLEPVGTASGRSLQARKAIIDQDFTIDRLAMEYEAAYRKPPSTEQLEAMQKQIDELKAINEALEKSLAESDAKNQDYQKQLEEAHSRLVSGVPAPTPYTGPAPEPDPSTAAPEQPSESGNVTKAARVARGFKKLMALKGRSTAFSIEGIVTEVGDAVFDIALGYAEQGVSNLADFLKRVRKRLGPDTDKLLQPLTDAFNKAVAQVKQQSPNRDFELESITSRIDPYDNDSVGRAARSLHSYVIRRDDLDASADGRTAAVDAVYEILVDHVPFITRDQTARAMSGIGVYRELSKDEAEVIRRDQKAQLLSLEQIADWKKGQAPPATGQERPPVSEEQRELRRMVNEAKKEAGIVESREGQLKSALDAAKRMTRNRIADLDKAINRTKKPIPGKARILKDDGSPAFAELTKLRAERDELQRQYDEMFGKNTLTDEQRLERAEKALDRAIADLEADLKVGKLYEDAPRPPVTSPAIEAKQAVLDALRANRYEMRLLSGAANARQPQMVSDAAFERHLKQRDAELAIRLAAKDFAPRPKKPEREYTPEQLKLMLSKQKKEQKIREESRKWVFDNSHPVYKALTWGPVTASAIIRKGLTTVDQSLILRQGYALGVSHPKLYAKAIRKAFPSNPLKAWSIFPTEQDLFNTQAELDADAHWVRLEKIAKLVVTDVHGGLNREEGHQSVPEWVNKLPGVGGSERAGSAFINTQRRLVFRSLVDKLSKTMDAKGKRLSAAELRVIGNLVNVATGRVNTKNLAVAVKNTSDLFFSPNWWASRLMFMTGQPMWHESRWFKGEGVSPEVRKLVMMEWGKQAAAQAAIIGLVTGALYAALGPGGDDEEWDFYWEPSSPNFGRLRINNTVFDMTAGVGQHVSFLYRMSTGKQTDRWETSEVDWGRLLLSYGRGKLAPVPSMVADFWAGKSMRGDKFGSPEWALRKVVPLSFQDVDEARSGEEPLFATAVAGLMFFGQSAQTYEDRIRARRDTANAIRVLQKQGKPQERIDAVLNEHLKYFAAKEAQEALRTADPERVDALQKIVDGTESPELSEAIEKEKGDVTLIASELMSTEDKRKADKKSPDADVGIATARELVKAMAPTYEEANRIYTEAYKRRNGSTTELVGGQFRTKKNVSAARRRLKAMYAQ